jgi:hypothetical protein
MRIIQSAFFLPAFFVFSLFSQSPCYGAPRPFPWTMFLLSITSGNSCGGGELIADRYLVNNCGVAKDTVTNLEWQRCSVGQTWNAETKSCDGYNTPLNWYSANQLALNDGWRLPTVTELRSLVYCSSGDPALIGMALDKTSCGGTFTRPTIVVEAFPNVPYAGNVISSHYWSSTTSVDDPNSAWGVSFYKGSVSPGPKDTAGLSVRLVRNAPITPGQAWNVKVIDYETNHTSTSLAEGIYMDQGAWQWRSWATCHNGGYRFLTVELDPNRHGIAFWSVQMPKTGWYKLETSYFDTHNRTNDADYAVYVNKTPAEAANHSATPVYQTSINQIGPGIVPWVSLGTYCLHQNDISMLVLDNMDDTQSASTDASRWTFVGEEYNSARCSQ